MRKVFSCMMIVVFLISMSVFSLRIQTVKASGTIYIRADGSIDPPTAPILTVDNVTYTLTGNIAGGGNGIVVERDDIVIEGDGYTLQGSREYPFTGVNLTGRSNATIKNMRIMTFYYGIYLQFSFDDIISGDDIADSEYGIRLQYSYGNSISGNNITNNYYGIWLDFSSLNTVSGNNIATNEKGIYLGHYSNDNSVDGNNITANDLIGIELSSFSGNNSISGNNITNNEAGIGLDHSSSNIISGNNITSNNCHGIRLDYSFYDNISRNNITANKMYGIVFCYSNNNNVSGNNITANSEAGILLDSSSGNIISGNNITNNTHGITFGYSNNNNFSGNNIADNEYGLWLELSSGNEFYHNNFIYNINLVLSDGSVNVWDVGYPLGGNYWSGYTGVDEKSGPSQDQPGSDGIGDTPYVIDGNNRDRYPYVQPYKPMFEPLAIFSYTIRYEEYEVTFDASGSLDPDGFIVVYAWDFGDGETGTGMIVTHKYMKGTAYIAILTVTDNDGLTASTTLTVAIGNLRAVSIEPVQAVWGVNLVQDKATDFKIGYDSTFDVIMEADIKLETPGFIPKTYQFKYRFAPGSHSFVIGNTIALSPFFRAHTKPEATFRFTIDPGNLIGETDETDNTFPRTGFEKRTVTDTKRLNILFVAVRFDNEDGDPGYFNGFSRVDFEVHAIESVRYFKATYPLAESEVSYALTCFNAPVNAGPRPTTEAEADACFTALLHILSSKAGIDYDRVVGVVRNNWFAGILGWTYTLGFAGNGWGRGAVVTIGHWKTSPHEIGHTYNLRHSNYNGIGYYVIGRTFVNSQTFMSTGDTDELPVPPNPPAQPTDRSPVPNFWIRSDEYQGLLTALTVKADPEIVLVSGTFWRNGTVELDDWYRFPSGISDFETGAIGNYYVVQRDGFGNLLSSVGFNVTFDDAIYGHSFEKLPLAFTIPYASGAKIVQILNQTGHIVASRIITDNAPTVRMLSPNGGEILASDHVQVSWEASDPDGDPLVYNLLVSGDGGLTWNPIEIGLKQTTYNLPLTGFSGGSKYVVKVIASDGVNTGEDVSDGFFTIASFTINVITPAQIVPIEGKTNYTLNITSYGGFSDAITLNAGSTTTDKLVFQWLNGSTILPVPNGSTTTILQVEAPDATEGGNHTLVLWGTCGNNTEVAITYLFASSHDLAITCIAPSKTVVGQGFLMTINVTTQNQGNFGETFTVSLHSNQTLIPNKSTYLSPRTSTTLTFTWNTSGLAKGNYTINAYAWPVPNETDTTDNNFTDGWVTVAMVGDLTGNTTDPWDFVPDGVVDGSDLIVVSRCFGSWPTAPPPMKWHPNCDITNDGVIDGSDMIIVSRHYGEQDP